MVASYRVARSTLATSALFLKTIDCSPTSNSSSPVCASRRCTTNGCWSACTSSALSGASSFFLTAAAAAVGTLNAPMAPTAPSDPLVRNDLRLISVIPSRPLSAPRADTHPYGVNRSMDGAPALFGLDEDRRQHLWSDVSEESDQRIATCTSEITNMMALPAAIAITAGWVTARRKLTASGGSASRRRFALAARVRQRMSAP